MATDRPRILKKINTINCDCQIQLNQLVYKITSGIEYNIDFVNYEIDFAQIKIFPDDKQSKWEIQIEMSDEPESPALPFVTARPTRWRGTG